MPVLAPAAPPPLVTTGPANWAQAVTSIAVAITAIVSVIHLWKSQEIKREARDTRADVAEVKTTLRENTAKEAAERAAVAAILKEHTELLRRAEEMNDGLLERELRNVARMTRREANRYPEDAALAQEAAEADAAVAAHMARHRELKSMTSSELRETMRPEGIPDAGG